MTLSQNIQKLTWIGFVWLILLLIGSIYYLHLTNSNPALGIADKNLVFSMTSLLEILLLIIVLFFSKKYYDEKARQKLSDIFGCTALIVLVAGWILFGILGTPPIIWLPDLFVQTITITASACIAVTPKKGDFTMGISMFFPLMATIVYLCYRF